MVEYTHILDKKSTFELFNPLIQSLNCFIHPFLAVVGFEVPDKFLVGYALDYNEYFRDLNVSMSVKTPARVFICLLRSNPPEDLRSRSHLPFSVSAYLRHQRNGEGEI